MSYLDKWRFPSRSVRLARCAACSTSAPALFCSCTWKKATSVFFCLTTKICVGHNQNIGLFPMDHIIFHFSTNGNHGWDPPTGSGLTQPEVWLEDLSSTENWSAITDSAGAFLATTKFDPSLFGFFRTVHFLAISGRECISSQKNSKLNKTFDARPHQHMVFCPPSSFPADVSYVWRVLLLKFLPFWSFTSSMVMKYYLNGKISFTMDFPR